MNLFNSECPIDLRWKCLRDFYEVTRKPRGFNLPPSTEVLFVPMDAFLKTGNLSQIIT